MAALLVLAVSNADTALTKAARSLDPCTATAVRPEMAVLIFSSVALSASISSFFLSCCSFRAARYVHDVCV